MSDNLVSGSSETVDRQRGSDDRVERAFVRNAQMTRLLVGDALGDALGLPFNLSARLSARASLRVLRAYGWACGLPVAGDVLIGVHRALVRLMRWVEGTATFPMVEECCPFARADA